MEKTSIRGTKSSSSQVSSLSAGKTWEISLKARIHWWSSEYWWKSAPAAFPEVEIFFYCPGHYLSPHFWASSLRRPMELGTFQIMTLSCQNSSGTGYKMLSRHSCSSSSTPAEPHHNTGRCSQIASPLPPEAHPLLVQSEIGVLDSDVLELGGENPTDAVIDDWNMNIFILEPYVLY